MRDVEDVLTPGCTWRLDVRTRNAPLYRIKVKAEHIASPRPTWRRQVQSDRAGTGKRRLAPKGRLEIATANAPNRGLSDTGIEA